jgi:hypothetical protein
MNSQDPAPIRGGGIAQVIGQMKAERLRFGLMRLCFAALALLTLALLAWALPFIPLGATRDDYTASTAIALLLCLMGWVGSVAFLLVWAPSFRKETFPDFVRVLFGANQLIRGRLQFESRLSAECRRAKQDRRHVFSLIVVQVGTSRSDTLSRERRGTASAAVVIRSGVRGDDLVAEIDPNEVWVLALAAPPDGRERVVERLARALLESHASEGATHSYRIGAGTYGEDGDDAEALFAAARARVRSLAQLLDAVPKAA